MPPAPPRPGIPPLLPHVTSSYSLSYYNRRFPSSFSFKYFFARAIVVETVLTGNLSAEDYEQAMAIDPRIDALRDVMVVEEDLRFSQDYLAPDKRSIANAIQVFFKDGSHTEQVVIEYPIGHQRRRADGIPVLQHKFQDALATRFPKGQSQRILAACAEQGSFEAMSVLDFMSMWSI